jgi:hypothetical protein
MFKIKNVSFSLLIFLSISVFSQDNEVKKWKFAFQFDNRFSSISKNDITIFGAKAGIQYKNSTRFGLGVSFITNPVTIQYFNKKTEKEETNTVNFWYISLFNDWILYKDKNWECFVTEQIGYGKPSFTREINDEIVSDVNVGLLVNEISGQAGYKINDWIGLGTGFGYRNLINRQANLKAAFNAPIYIVKIIIYPEVFFRKTNF